jgi:hypothetical protein
VENCHFKGVTTVLDASYGGSPKVTIVGSDRGNGNTNGGTSAPAYSYTAIPWELVEAAVTGPCGAGATLQVNESTGAVSCGSATSTANRQQLSYSNAESFMRTSGQSLQIRFTQNGRVDIFDLKGAKIRTMNLQKGNHTIKIGNISKGMYVVKANSGGWNQSINMLVR